MSEPPPSSPPTPPAASATPATPAAPGTPAAVEPPAKKVEFRNVIVLTMCGVVLVLIFLLISYFMGHAGNPKQDFRTDMQAPNFQTAPQNAPLKTAEWYLRRGREAFNRRDFSACQMLIDDLHDQLKQQPNLLDAQGQLDLKDLEEDVAAATGRRQ